VGSLTKEISMFSSSFTKCSWASRSQDHASPRSVISVPLQASVLARYAFPSRGTAFAISSTYTSNEHAALLPHLDGRTASTSLICQT